MKPKIVIRFFMKYLLLLTVGIYFFIGNLRGQTVTTDSILQTSPCAGSNIYIPYTVSGGSFTPFFNVFIAELSDKWGSFDDPVNIGSIPYWSSGMIIGKIPQDASFGFAYRVRIVSSSPADTSPPSPNTVIVTTVAEIATVGVTPNDTICEGDSALLAVLTPKQDYVWSTGETTQSISVSQSGSYTVTVTDGLGCKTSSDPEDITVQVCNSIAETLFSAENILVFPNPVKDEFSLLIPDLNSDGDLNTIILKIYDITGKLIFTPTLLSSLYAATGNNLLSFKIAPLEAGFYFYELISDRGVLSRDKFIAAR